MYVEIITERKIPTIPCLQELTSLRQKSLGHANAGTTDRQRDQLMGLHQMDVRHLGRNPDRLQKRALDMCLGGAEVTDNDTHIALIG